MSNSVDKSRAWDAVIRAREDEREKCAKIADRIEYEADKLAAGLSYGELYGMQSRSDAAKEIAAAIRARKS